MASGAVDSERLGTEAREQRRIRLAREPNFRIGPLLVRPSRRSLTHEDGREQIIEPRVMQVLAALHNAGGEIVGRDDLIDRCWDGRIVGEDAINRVMSRLRRTAQTIGESVFRIETITKAGYRLDIDPTCRSSPVAGTETAAAAAATSDFEPYQTEVVAKSLAVLPFANLTGDPAKEYLADGMAEELIVQLSHTTSLKIAARTSTFGYKGRGDDVRSIARQLGVSAVLEGSVRFAGERLRVTAQLIDATTGYHLWSRAYDREVGDWIAIQDEIAESIASTLKAKLTVANPYKARREAVELHLQARGMSSRLTPESLLGAIQLYERSIACDPGFARARAGLAGTLMVATATGALPPDSRSDARKRANEALQLDPGYVYPYSVLGALDAAAGRWLEAEEEFRAATGMDPEEPVALEAMALQLLAPVGQLRRGCELAEKAVRLAPASANRNLTCAYLALLRGNLEPQEEHLRIATLLGVPEERGTVRVMRAEAARRAGRVAEATGLMAAALSSAPPLRDAGAEALTIRVHDALAGKIARPMACSAIAEFLELTDTDDALWRYPTVAGYLIHWLVLLGAIDDAFALAERLLAAWRRSGHLAFLSLPVIWRSDMRAFREDRRFQSLVECLDLIRYWERYGPPDGYMLRRGQLQVARTNGASTAGP